MQLHEKFVSPRGWTESRARIFVINTACDTFWARAKAEKVREKSRRAGSTNLRRINSACVRNFLQRDLTPRDPRDLTLERDIRVPGNESAPVKKKRSRLVGVLDEIQN